MLQSLRCVSNKLNQSICIVSYSDIFYDVETVKVLLSEQSECVITFDPNWQQLWEGRFEDPLSDAESFRLDGDACVIEIGQSAASVEEIQGQYMGLMKFTPTFWRKAELFFSECSSATLDKMDMTTFLQEMITRQVKVKAVPVMGEWGEVDNPEDITYYETESKV